MNEIPFDRSPYDLKNVKAYKLLYGGEEYNDLNFKLFYLMGLTTYGNYNIEDTASFTVYVPKIEECFATSLAVIPLQLMGYYVSVAKGLDVDKPRNLAKSVTVE